MILTKISIIDDFTEVDKLRKVLFIIDFFGGTLPNYIFFFRSSDKNFGGIEHKDSSAIVANWEQKIYSGYLHMNIFIDGMLRGSNQLCRKPIINENKYRII